MAQKQIKSEITGTVWKIEVSPGDTVSEDDPLMILEAMKMEIPVLATEDGTVAQILVKETEPVSEEQPLLLFETQEPK